MSLYCILRSLRTIIILLLDSDVTRLHSIEGKTIFDKFTWGRQEKEALSGFSRDESVEDNNLLAVVEDRSVREGWTFDFSIND